jgi:hypothetical protein
MTYFECDLEATSMNKVFLYTSLPDLTRPTMCSSVRVSRKGLTPFRSHKQGLMNSTEHRDGKATLVNLVVVRNVHGI